MELPKSYTVNLRTLALKSILGFGKYFDNSVSMVLSMGGYPYLRWVYFNLSQISFNEEVLKELGITKKWKIAKPGTDKEKGYKFKKIKAKERYEMIGKKIEEAGDMNKVQEIQTFQHRKGARRRRSEQLKRMKREDSWRRYRSSSINPTKS